MRGARDGLGYLLAHTRRCQALETEGRTSSGTATTNYTLRSFIDTVNFYRDMVRKRSHTLSPLTEQSWKRNIHWT
jgi:hypothetical protein